ncbi:hypothetical protein D3C71_1964870 [compost metagenome]
MTSVIRNTTGHSKVPAVKLNEPVWPNRFHCSGAMPRVSSRAKILTPMNSASAALTQKNADNTMNKRSERSCKVRVPSPPANGMLDSPALTAWASRDRSRRSCRR